MEKYCLRKGINTITSYMSSLGFDSCIVGLDSDYVIFQSCPYRDYNVKVTFSPKGRCIKVEKISK